MLRTMDSYPFPHLVTEGWFSEQLLELVHEEYDISNAPALKAVANAQQSVRRSPPVSEMGPASQMYFNLVNSGLFTQILTDILGVDHLIADGELYGGGMHETREGGRFNIHRDFDRHKVTALNNEMVLITYLNKNWNPEWSGALELWDREGKKCVKVVQPDFGRTIIMRHLDHSYHGHPHPLTPPAGVTRRSIATYYYSNPRARIERDERRNSNFLVKSTKEKVIEFTKSVTPPVVWNAIKKLKR